jgi:iron complex transport system substrate-binding protein
VRWTRIKISSLILLALLSSQTAWAEAPVRIVSLKPTITDVVYALGLGERLVGVTRYCNIPKGRKGPAIVADYTRPYVERIVALSSDLVLGSRENSSRRSIDNLKRMGLKVKLFPFGKMEDSLESIVEIADALGEGEHGRKLAKKLRLELAKLKRTYGEKPTKRAVIVWGRRPMVVAGSGTFMDEALAYIGSKNAVRGSGVKYPKIGLEELIALNPDIIVDLSMGSEREDTAARPWERTDAIKTRVISMDMNDFRAGPRLIEGLKKLGREIHR